jgi:hypothetical protein
VINLLTMRIIQVLWNRPIEEHILAFKQFNAFHLLNGTEESEALVNVIIWGARTARKVKEARNVIVRPWFCDVKVKLPNSVIQVSFYGLMELKRGGKEGGEKVKCEILLIDVERNFIFVKMKSKEKQLHNEYCTSVAIRRRKKMNVKDKFHHTQIKIITPEVKFIIYCFSCRRVCSFSKVYKWQQQTF